MLALQDQLGRPLHLPGPPRRIVSLVPSLTELLHYLGLEEETVGITKFCTQPESWFRSKQRVGGTKTIDLAIIEALRPDLILANQEENDREAVEQLMRRYPVYVSRVVDIPSAREAIRHIAYLTGTAGRAEDLIADIQGATDAPPPFAGQRAAYFIWQNPYMVAGGDTYISAVMDALGLVNVYADRTRYPTTTLEACRALATDHVLLSSEPFPFAEKHLATFRQALPEAQIHLVDGTLFSWYGPRLARLGAAFLPQATPLSS